jgi:hypothetical protein
MLYPLYIDPGTGSMLFSILIGAAATLYFLVRTLWVKLKVNFGRGRIQSDNSGKTYVMYSEGRQYWNLFKPILDEFEGRGIEASFLTSSEDDPVFENDYRFVKPEYIGLGNRAYARLNFLSAAVVLMTTPGLNVYQLKRAKTVGRYVHILHAPGDATLYRMFGLDYFDAVLLTGEYQAKDIRFLEQLRGLPEKKLVTVGCTYLDFFAEKIAEIPQETNHPFTVLVSPSWGPSALLSRYGKRLLDPLRKTGWRIIIRPHPQSRLSEKAMLESLEKRYGDAANIEWDYNRDNIFSLVKADVMISDFSGIIYDFIFLCDKPVIYVHQDFDIRPYDADDLDHELWQFTVLREIGVELREEHFNRIEEFVSGISERADLKDARKKARDMAWQYRGEAAKRTVDYMTSCVKESSGNPAGISKDSISART